jgi:hypothetical protein
LSLDLAYGKIDRLLTVYIHRILLCSPLKRHPLFRPAGRLFPGRSDISGLRPTKMLGASPRYA